MEKIFFFLFVSSLTLRQCLSSIVLGVNPNRLPLYDPSKDFTCLDGSKTINFSNVNDDYCDCEDSSDEPGTSACPNGRFFCENNGYLAQLLPSSRVNDGICDCCDGSDEHGNEKDCQNNCFELGREYREQKEREKQMFSQGAALRDDLSKQGKLKKEQRLNEHADLKVKADEKKELVENLKVHKENVEKLENEAKTKHDKEWEEKINQIKAERDLERAQNAFASFDVDESGSLTIQEIQASINLDKMYTEEEAQELLGGAVSVDRESFVSQLWESKFRDIFNKTKPLETPDEGDVGTPPPPTEEPPEPPSDGNVDKNDDEKDLDSVTGMSQDEADDDDDDDDDENEKDEEDEEDIKDEEGGTPSATDKVDDEGLPKKPDYDEETKKLIEDADKVRQEFEETTREKDDLLKKLAEIDRLNQIDMGEHEEFSPLHGHCFEFTDREYTYKLCPFDKASQTSKNGNSEVSLGTWGEWSGQPYKYSEMKFTNGLSCWNGPSRSTTVKVSCGIKNDLVGVSEPSKCEYEFIFHTPAACHPNFHPHDEF
ncbi:glucosidase 2 subunit beta-like [Xenia sp. Carnegie-2017]|uniref:glucosidase 2 subunit beta-like n=1 Tax=Xenia sp. Carnegie-2017 TaxID=2897299 RepID=UPI001F036083|nr:glucosidase 2 subunit beta-like [Xenia sp. Carnegie-2017]